MNISEMKLGKVMRGNTKLAQALRGYRLRKPGKQYIRDQAL